MDDPTGFAAGQIIRIGIGNELDDARIIAGSPPRFYLDGDVDALNYITLVTDVTGDVITVDPGLPIDCTNFDVTLHQKISFPSNKYCSFVGFEKMRIGGNDVVASTFTGSQVDNVWLYEVEVNDFNNYGVYFSESYRCQVEKCVIGPGRAGGSNSAGILNDSCTASLFVNNIILPTSSSTQQNAGSVGNAWIYNFYCYNPTGNSMLISHGSGNCQNLYEGNIVTLWKADGYFGACTYETMWRNWFTASNNNGSLQLTSVSANRFTRNFTQTGNVFGWDGAADAWRSYGNPNIGNGDARGFAGPTGLSEMEGQTDYSQPGYGANEYIIQAEDISEGDFWADWKIVGTVTDKISDTEAVFTMSNGYFVANGSQITTTLWWDGRTKRRRNTEVINVDGSSITLGATLNTAGDVMPINGTVVEVWMGSQGFQERDLDVQPSFTEDHNYISAASGTGAIENPTVETLPDSFAYSSQPDWWTEDGFSGTWPPVNPDLPQFEITILPAGQRYVDSLPPELAVDITNPNNGSNITYNTSTSLEGTAVDPEDGTISSSIVWSSNVSGTLGTGSTVIVTLAPGTHLITATITDSDDNEDFATITLYVAEAPPTPRKYKLKASLISRRR